jgi:hypothetical protein
MNTDTRLLPKVKGNLMLAHGEDDDFVKGLVRAAVGYAEGYQHLPTGHYSASDMSPVTEQAVIMLASHLYESRDGSTGGFFGDSTSAARQVWHTVNSLLRLDRDWGLGV